MSRASMSCGTIPSSLYVCDWSPHKREKGTGKKFEEKIATNFSNLMKRIKHKVQKAS